MRTLQRHESLWPTKFKDKLLTRFFHLIRKYIFWVFIPKLIEQLWKCHPFIYRNNSHSSRRALELLISDYHNDGLAIFPLNKRLNSIVQDIRNMLVKDLSNLEKLTDINKKFYDDTPEFKKYRTDLICTINPLPIIKILASRDVYSFVKGIYPNKKPRIAYIGLWIDGINSEFFPESTETRLFHRDSNGFGNRNREGRSRSNAHSKFYILLSNVEQVNGPFTYVKGSHKVESQKLDRSRLIVADDRIKDRDCGRFLEKSVLDAYGESNFVYLTGPPGTSAFTNPYDGLHKGVRQAPGFTRVMLCVEFAFH